MDKEINKERVLKGLRKLIEMTENDDISFFCGVFACPDGQTGKFIHGGGVTIPHIIGELYIVNNMLSGDFIKEVYPLESRRGETATPTITTEDPDEDKLQ